MPDESLVFKILADDQASAGFARAGRSASAASDDVLALARRLDEVSKKAVTARVGLTGNKEAAAALDDLGLKLLRTGQKVANPKISLDGAAKASVEIEALDVQLDRLAAKAGEDGAEGALSRLAGIGSSIPGGGMGALIGAGVLLSPVLVTLGTGLGGFGAAAAGAISPIERAAQKAGGLQQNMHMLNPEQQALARSLLGLGKDYDAFQKQLQPEVLGVFGKGIGIVSQLMHSAEPVAQATGRALDGVLGSLSADLHDQQWTSFFAWMAANAPEDIRLVSGALGNLINTLPVLLKDLNPVAQALLGVTDTATKLVQLSTEAGGGLLGTGKAAKQASGWMGDLEGPLRRVTLGVVTLGGSEVLRAADGLAKTGSAASGPGAKGLNAFTAAAKPAATAVQLLNSDLQKLSGLLGDQSAEVTWRQSLNAAAKAIDGGSAALDGNTSKALANRQQVIQSTQNLLALIQSEQKTGGSVGGMSRQLQTQISFLERAHDKSAWMRTELGLLEKALLNVKSEQVRISVNASGVWHVAPGGGLPGGTAGGPFAAGGMVRGGVAGRDSVLGALTPGEVVVPVPMVNAGAVDHLRGRLPGFAAGGVVGSYGGSVPGLDKWVRSENQSTLVAVADAVTQAFKSAAASASSGGGGHAGPGGGSDSANEALARSLFPWPSAQWAPFVAVAMRESGFSNIALNASSGAYGIAQALPASKYPLAGRPPSMGGSSNPTAQLTWMFSYIAGRYGTPANAEQHELTAGWYDKGGYLPPGLSLAYNGLGRPEPVGAAAGDRHYHVNIVLPPAAAMGRLTDGEMTRLGQGVIKAIQAAERKSGPGWRS